MPAGVERAEAEGILDLLIAKNLGRLPQGTTVDVSELRFVDHLAKLSAVTKDPSDTDLIRAGGLTLRISQVQKSDNWTLTSNSTINIGLE